MEEAWKTVARRMLTAAGADQSVTIVPTTIDRALFQLAAGIRRMKMNLNTETNAWHISNASEYLDDALRDLFYFRTLHISAGHVFVLSGARRGISAVHPVWHRWKAHNVHGNAVYHAALALRSLRSAASNSRASRHAVLVSRAFPDPSPARTAWHAAALNLARITYRDAIVAQHEARRMGRAVAREVCARLDDSVSL
jgi:hypothetical protein